MTLLRRLSQLGAAGEDLGAPLQSARSRSVVAQRDKAGAAMTSDQTSRRAFLGGAGAPRAGAQPWPPRPGRRRRRARWCGSGGGRPG